MKHRIGEAARRAKLHPETLRRLERRGVISSTRDVNQHRVYDSDTVQLLRQLYQRTQGKTPPGEESAR